MQGVDQDVAYELAMDGTWIRARFMQILSYAKDVTRALIGGVY